MTFQLLLCFMSQLVASSCLLNAFQMIGTGALNEPCRRP
jgi:hypothetical protein